MEEAGELDAQWIIGREEHEVGIAEVKHAVGGIHLGRVLCNTVSKCGMVGLWIKGADGNNGASIINFIRREEGYISWSPIIYRLLLVLAL